MIPLEINVVAVAKYAKQDYILIDTMVFEAKKILYKNVSLMIIELMKNTAWVQIKYDDGDNFTTAFNW